ncbi:MAG: histidine-type phosphatase [Lachnospiraceae bacterium]|nr:histidine-type phosphatase [Lachnospiraceae bacterium]
MNWKKFTSFCIAAAMALQVTGCAATQGSSDGGTATQSAVTGSSDASAIDSVAGQSAATDLSENVASTDSDATNSGASTESDVTGSGASTGSDAAGAGAAVENTLSRDGYTLEQVVVLSRHNIRSPLSSKGSTLDSLTPYDWFEWSSNPSELSVRGGNLETEMGQYFRKWLENEGLFPENYRPEEGEVRFYANAKQRTIATASFFKAGLLPVADTEVEYHAEYDTMDPVFEPKLTFATDDYCAAAEEQMREVYDKYAPGLEEEYALLSDVLDVEETEDYKSGTFTGFHLDDLEITLEEGKEPGMSGSLKVATSLSDALVLQYYETEDGKEAFGKSLTFEQWEDIAAIKDAYQDVLFTAPLVSINAANPLLREISSELGCEGRKFTFLCGHDSNVGSVLAALGAEDYALDYAIEKKTPIGVKLLFNRFSDADGKEYISLDLVYEAPDQLKHLPILDLKNPPASAHVKLQGLEEKEDGLYEASAVEARFTEAIAEYDEMVEEYSVDAAA